MFVNVKYTHTLRTHLHLKPVRAGALLLRLRARPLWQKVRTISARMFALLACALIVRLIYKRIDNLSRKYSKNIYFRKIMRKIYITLWML